MEYSAYGVERDQVHMNTLNMTRNRFFAVINICWTRFIDDRCVCLTYLELV